MLKVFSDIIIGAELRGVDGFDARLCLGAPLRF